MKFSRLGQVALATAASLGLAFGITACGVSNTIDFLYVASSKNNPGQISIYALDSESGALAQVSGGSPIPSGGRNPVAMATTPNGKFLYVVNHDDNTVVEFAIGSDGKVYPQNTYNTPGTNPDAIAISADGSLLFVVDAFQPGFSASNPGPGAVVVSPIAADGSLTLSGTSAFTPTCNNPVAVNVLNSGSTVYVVDDPGGQLPALGDVNSSSNTGAGGATGIVYPAVGNCLSNSSATTSSGQISSFVVGSGGALTEAAGSPFAAGVAPSAIASDPTNRFVYVTDSKSNLMYGYSVQPNGLLAPLIVSNFPTGVFPDAVLVDPRGQFIYVANYSGGGSVSGYAINTTTGVPSLIAGTGAYPASTGPTSVLMEPALGRYVYTSNFLDNSVSGLFLTNPSTGALTAVQNSPYPTSGGGQPTALAAVRHGDHAVQVVPQY